MPKRLRDYQIYLAPQISGVLKKNGEAYVYDELSNKVLNPYNVIDKLVIYERQVRGWFLDIADNMPKSLDYGFVVLMVCSTYIEGVEQYRRGYSSHNNSRQMFIDGMKRIFGFDNTHDRELREFYSQVRCELFHTGMSGGHLIISNKYDKAIDFPERGTITVNPQK